MASQIEQAEQSRSHATNEPKVDKPETEVKK
jgi:hypothetical protein